METELEIAFDHRPCSRLSEAEVDRYRARIKNGEMYISTTAFGLFEPVLNFSGVGFLIKAATINAAGMLGFDQDGRMAMKGKLLDQFDCERLTEGPFEPIDFRKRLIERVPDPAIKQVIASPSRRWVLTLLPSKWNDLASRLENMTSPYAELEGFRYYGQAFGSSVLFSDPSDAMVFKLAGAAQ